MLLSRSLDRPWTRFADGRQGDFRRDALLDEQARGDHPGASEPTAAVNENIVADSQKRPQVGAVLRPSSFKARIGNAHVADRQVKPFESASANGFAKRRNSE